MIMYKGIILLAAMSVTLLCPLKGELKIEAPNDPLQLVTDFRSYFINNNETEVRVIVSDQSASVAFRPIKIFIVVTNNMTGPTGYCKIYSAPSVSNIESIEFDKESKSLLISYINDQYSEEGVKKNEVKGKLKIKIIREQHSGHYVAELAK